MHWSLIVGAFITTPTQKCWPSAAFSLVLSVVACLISLPNLDVVFILSVLHYNRDQTGKYIKRAKPKNMKCVTYETVVLKLSRD